MALDIDVIVHSLPALIDGLWATAVVMGAGFPVGLILGIVTAYAAQSASGAIRRAALLYVELVRNVPFLIIVYLGFFGLPKLGITISAFAVGTGAIVFCTGGYFCEIMRAGLRSVPEAQRQAARSLGMSSMQTQRYVVMPQLWPLVAPAGTNLAIQMVKDSSVFSVMSMAELTFQSQVLTADTFAYVEIFGTTAFLYWCANQVLDMSGQLIERQLSRWKRL